MTKQYNLAMKLVGEERRWMLEEAKPNAVITYGLNGDINERCLSIETLPYIGELLVFKTLEMGEAEIYFRCFSRIEGMLVFPITECEWEQELKRLHVGGNGNGRNGNGRKKLKSERLLELPHLDVLEQKVPS